MKPSMIVFLSILGYFVFAIIFQIIYDLIKREICYSNAKNKTDPFVQNLGYVICITGKQGQGKSTLGSGLVNVQTKLYQSVAIEKMEDVRLLLDGLNFNKLDYCIRDAFSLKQYNTDHIIEVTYSVFPEILEFCKQKYYDDGTNYISYTELLRDYVDAYLSILKSNYVYFLNSDFYSRVTEKYAMYLDYETTAIKDRYLSKDYSLYRYAIIFEDEAVIGIGNNQNWQEEAKQQPGVDLLERLIRHVGKGNVKYFLCTQNFTRLAKDRRELATNILDVRIRKEVKSYSFLNWLYYMKFGILKYLDTFIADTFPTFYRKHFKTKNHLRTMLAKTKKKMARLDGYDYLRFQGYHYLCEEDYRKASDRSSLFPIQTFDLWLPKTFCWGSLNTYLFSSVHDVLSFESRNCKKAVDINPKPDKKSREEFAKKILQKHEVGGNSPGVTYDGDLPEIAEDIPPIT